MRLHLLSLPHTQITEQYLSCAYTQKVAKFCRMMGKDHEIILYAGEHVSGTTGYAKHVVCVTEKERAGWFGDGFNTVHTPLKWEGKQEYWQTFARRAIPEMERLADRGDICLMTSGGDCQSMIPDTVNKTIAVEWAVGYEGITSHYCAFESYAWMSHVYGLRGIRNGRAFDQVIPNFFDPDEFLKPTKLPGKYLLYLGRVVERKGPHIAGLIAKRLGMKLIVAGPGATQKALGPIEGEGCTIDGDVRYVGEVGLAERADLLQNAACLLVPTVYVEPFGGVAVEAMMSGCPVVASDWGAFPETVTAETGRRFRTLNQGCRAVIEAMKLDRFEVARVAKEKYSLDAVRPRFNGWFEQIESLKGDGWYT